jgi:cyclopropane fatty-acyl-phospholipid synthase-like methyltransferase
MTASEWSIQWWKGRHEAPGGYFPGMDWHKDWKICPYPPPMVMEKINPRSHEMGLEIGCGYGEWMVPLAKAFKGTLRGIDIHPSLEVKAEEVFSANGVEDFCKFYLSDGLDIPFPTWYFDFVYSISVFQHIPKATVIGYLVETNRVLRRGGRFLFHFRHDDGIGDYSKDIEVDHKGDFSTGWTPQEVVKAINERDLKWSVACEHDSIHNLFVYGRKL